MTDTPTEREEGGGWARLRRRKVVQWGVAYAAAAWTLLQIIEYLAETYDWPPAIRQISVPTFSLLSLFVLVLAWHHGDKGRQKISRQELALLASLLLAAGGVLWWFVARLDANDWLPASAGVAVPHAVPTDAPSVAVLPFVNMSSDPEQEYFSDGLSEEILNALARIPGLYVPARTSSFQFKGKSGDVARFAAMLGVAHVLEGSVRKSGGRVRITAQLVSAADGYHVWSQTYDRELADVFAIQEEISNSIAAALEIRLTAQQKLDATLAPPTANLDAYQEYLLGRFEYKKRRWDAVGRAIEHYERAVALDPQFADAYASLAAARIRHSKEYLLSEAEKASIKDALDKALAIAPDRPAVLAAMGDWLKLDVPHPVHALDAEGRLRADVRETLERSLDCYDRALALDPANAEVFTSRQFVSWLLGGAEGTLDSSEAALKRDPLSVSALRNRIWALLYYDRREEMRPLLDRMEVLDPISAHQIRGELAVRDGDLVGFTRHLLASLDIEPDPAPHTAGDLVWVFGALRLPAEVHNAAQLTSEPVHEALVLLSLGEPRAAVPLIRAEISEEQWAYNCWLGDVLYQLGEFRDADEAFRKCWEQGWPMLGDGGVRLLMAADSARRVGDLERSATYERWFETVLQQATAAGEVPDKFLMAFYHAYHGRTEEATRDLIAGEPWGERQGFQSSMPMFVELIQRPDYRAASARRQELRQRQRVEVIEMLCGPEPASRKYRPRPETCALRKNPG